MDKVCGFFQDSDGCLSYGRLASAFCCASALLCGLRGKHDLVGTFLTAAFSFYASSKATQAVTNVFGK